MSLPQEPQYKMFEAVCKCGRHFKYAAPARRHRDYLTCPDCDEAVGRPEDRKKWRVDLLRLEGRAKTVFKQIELMAQYRGDVTLGEIAKK